MAFAMAQINTDFMSEPLVPANPRMLRVLIATQSTHTGTALASLLGDPADICCEIVGLEVDLPLSPFWLQSHGVDVVLLDLEPWSVKALCTVPTMKAHLPPPLVLALVHGVGEPMRRQCREAGVDHLLDRTADLGRLQSLIADYAEIRQLKAIEGRGVL